MQLDTVLTPSNEEIRLLCQVNPVILCNQVRRASFIRRVSQHDVSYSLLTTSAYLSALELGKIRPTFKTLSALSQRLYKALDYFLRWSTGSSREVWVKQIYSLESHFGLLNVRTYLENDEYERAWTALEKMKVLLNRLKKPEKARYYYLLGKYHNMKGDTTQSLLNFNQAYHYLKESYDQEIRIWLKVIEIIIIGRNTVLTSNVKKSRFHSDIQLEILDECLHRPNLEKKNWVNELYNDLLASDHSLSLDFSNTHSTSNELSVLAKYFSETFNYFPTQLTVSEPDIELELDWFLPQLSLPNKPPEEEQHLCLEGTIVQDSLGEYVKEEIEKKSFLRNCACEAFRIINTNNTASSSQKSPVSDALYSAVLIIATLFYNRDLLGIVIEAIIARFTRLVKERVHSRLTWRHQYYCSVATHFRP